MISDDLRGALANRDFERVQSLICEWRESVAQEMSTAGTVPERCRILEDAQVFVEQQLYLARVIRSHIATELQANSASFLYADTDLEQPRWRIRG